VDSPEYSRQSPQHYFKNPRLLAVLLLSFSSGLPLALVGSTLQAWYTVTGVSLMTIGALTMVGQPYVYKFLWAPVMDRFAPLKLGRRLSWVLLMQIALVIGLCVIAFLQPLTHPWILAWVAFAVAFFSASQDIAIDAYRTDVLPMEERGLGAAVTTLGYRIAMLVSSALALIMAAYIGWRITYLIMAALIFIEIFVTLFSPKPQNSVCPPRTMADAVTQPIKEFFKRDGAALIIIFIIIYKLCDAFALSLNTPFLIRGIGFSLKEIGIIYKVVSLVATIVGSIIGGWLMPRLGVYRSLVYFGLLQAASNLSYMALALIGKSYVMTVTAVFAEYFCSGLSSVAIIVFLMSLCDRRYTATQYAIFSAVSAIGRVFVGPGAAAMVTHFGWATFYFLTFLIGIPPLFLLWWMKRRVDFAAAQVVENP
jgi:PAT family beta-lactamase induction signal transducer AmpG